MGEIEELSARGGSASGGKDADSIKMQGYKELEASNYKDAKSKYALAAFFNPRLISEISLDYEQILEKNPDDLLARLSLADLHLFLGEIEDAILELEEIIEIDPLNTEVYNILGRIYLKQGDYKEAIDLLESALEAGIKDIALTEMLAGAYKDMGTSEEAIALYEEVFMKGESKNALRALGELYARAGKFDLAAERFRDLFSFDHDAVDEVIFKLKELIKKAPASLYPREILVDIYISSIKPDDGVSELKEILRINKNSVDEVISKLKGMLKIYPENPKVILALAEANLERGLFTESAQGYKKLEGLSPPFTDEAIAGYKKIIAKYPNQVLARMYLGDIYLRKGLIEAALSEFRAVLELDQKEVDFVIKACRSIISSYPNFPLAHCLLGEAYLVKGEERKAIEEAETVISLEKDSLESYVLLGDGLRLLGLSGKASQAYKTALILSPYNITIYEKYKSSKEEELDEEIKSLNKKIKDMEWKVSLHLDLARAYVAKGCFDEAIAELKVGLKDSSHAPFSHNMLGLCFKEQGKFDLAIFEFKEALKNLGRELGDISKVIEFNLGASLEERGEVSEALSIYENIAQRDPSFQALDKRIKFLKESNPISLRVKSLIGAIVFPKGKQIIGIWGRDCRKVEKDMEALLVSFGENHAKAGFENYMRAMYKMAEEEFVLATSLDPSLPQALNNLGIILLKEGRTEEAYLKFMQAAEADPDFAPFYNNLGLVEYMRGDLKKAEIAFLKAQTLDPGLSVVYLNLGDIFYLQGNAKGALYHWSLVKDFDIVSELAGRRLLYWT